MSRANTRVVKIGDRVIGGGNPILIQSMTNTRTEDVQATVAQIQALTAAGCDIIRCAVPDMAAAEGLKTICEESPVPVIADIHFDYKLALAAIEAGVDGLRLNPGNIGGEEKVRAVVEAAKERNIPIRIGVNAGSLPKDLLEKYGHPTPEALVESAFSHIRMLEDVGFGDICVSMKSSNVPLMMQAYRLMHERSDYPLHVGVTETGTEYMGTIKSAMGIGGLLCLGIGDTIRVSLTEAPENEIQVAQLLVDHFARRSGEFAVKYPERYTPTRYCRRSDIQTPLIHSELPADWRVIEALTENPTAELRAAILSLDRVDEPVAVCRRYEDPTVEAVAVKAAADLGPLFLDGLADGIRIDAPHLSEKEIAEIELMILQAARVRFSHTEYIACPSCGRTLYDIEKTLADIKSRTSHLSNLKIGVMGCIVNGPGEMADADYGYVGAVPGRITLYKGRTVVARNIPQQEALDRLVELIKADGEWVEP